jgi:hypothetical protein
MPIPETQLETWSHQGAMTQSTTTYRTIKNVLEATDLPYADKAFVVFLQGSYGNDTNIYAESDVDIVIQLRDCWYQDVKKLTEGEIKKLDQAYSIVPYCFTEFKNDVTKVLKNAYGNAVKLGNNAITIAAGGNRRNADVLVTTGFRRYYNFEGVGDESYDEGICFFRRDGTQIANYPRQHSANCTAKHQATSSWFKPVVRIFKNLRGKLVDDGMIEADTAPSYYLEGLLYNVPLEHFSKSYVDSFVNCVNWINDADRSNFVCANEQYYLLREGSPVTWRASKCTAFLEAACDLWKQW